MAPSDQSQSSTSRQGWFADHVALIGASVMMAGACMARISMTVLEWRSFTITYSVFRLAARRTGLSTKARQLDPRR